MSYDSVIGVDPGASGGISVFDNNTLLVHAMPTTKKKVNKKDKKVYDLNGLLNILQPYRNKKVLFCLEVQNPRPMEGSVSSFSAGKGYGTLLGMAVTLGFHVIEVRPLKWKQHFQILNTDSIISKKEEMSELRKRSKTLKEKNDKKANTKEIEKLSRQIKSEAKGSAIELVKKMYPNVNLCLKRTDSDGMAESVLIARYGLDCQNELV